MYNLIPNLTVRENIEVGAYLSDHPLDVDELLHTLGLYEHQKNCRISYQEDSSRELRSDVQLSRIRISCCAMSRPSAGLSYVQGNPETGRDGKSEIWQYDYHGYT